MAAESENTTSFKMWLLKMENRKKENEIQCQTQAGTSHNRLDIKDFNSVSHSLGWDPGGGIQLQLQLHLYRGVWPQDWKIDPSAD